ncbi:MAG: putative spermidine/putrescine transport system ATP-binding protein [Thermoleophilaceae bacterium]|jgi:putative spermidine/putrescine transport system ATP-binding protein|nr:putative spermidine/putrescine transport system ATP-binding protein [Thermoleophilaceae bacterium]
MRSRAPAQSVPAAAGADAAARDVRLVGVRKTYGQVTAVDGVDIDIRAGEFFTMLGPSGSGKTTCLRMIAGFERPDAGRVELAGRDVTALPPQERDVNTVFQDYALFPHMTVAANVEYGLKVKKVARDERRARVDEALALVRLEGYGGRRPTQLSGGQRQRVALARALVNRPRLLLLDEPLGALDLKLRQQLQVELKRIQREVGITFVYVTHDQDEALSMSDRIAVMDAGKVLQVGPPHEVYDEPASRFVAGFVGVSNLLELPIESLDGAVATLRAGAGDAISADVGADVRTGEVAVVTIRPERIRLAEGAPAPADGCHAAGVVRESLYAGPVSRFVVELDGGGELMVVRQNTDTSFDDAEALRGRPVTLGWAREHTRVIGTRGGDPQ